MQKSTQNKALKSLDLFLAYLADGKKGEPSRSGYLRTAVLCLLLTAALVVLLILDQRSRMQTSLGPDVPLTLVTLLLAAGLVLCSMRSFFILRRT